MCARALGGADTQPITANVIARAQNMYKQHISTNNIVLQILQVSLLIINDVFNTNNHLQWR